MLQIIKPSGKPKQHLNLPSLCCSCLGERQFNTEMRWAGHIEMEMPSNGSFCCRCQGSYATSDTVWLEHMLCQYLDMSKLHSEDRFAL